MLWPNGSATRRPNLSAEGHFGYRNSTAPGASKYHRGQDFWGLGIIRAIEDGTVVAVGWNPYGWGGGYQVWIQHDGFFTRSLHMVGGSSPVRVGQRVKAGDPIGVEGMTGAYQVHLHLEITPGRWHSRNEGQVDPVPFIQARLTTGTPAAVMPERTDTRKGKLMLQVLRNKKNGDVFMVGLKRIKHIGRSSGKNPYADLEAAERVFGKTLDLDDHAFRVALIGYAVPYNKAVKGADWIG